MPMTTDIPKPMIPLANYPLMANTVRLLQQHGFVDLIANLHYHGECISNFFDDGRAFGVNLQYSPEEELMGTAGGVKRCAWFLNETFVIVSGDALTDINLTKLVQAHRRHGALATIALKEVPDVEHFGIVITDDDDRIKSFQEKPRPEEARSRVANTGIYVFEPEIFDYIPAGQFYDFGKQLFPQLVKMGSPFYGVPIDEYWCDVGNLDTYRQAHADVLSGKVQAKMVGELHRNESSQVLLGEGVRLGKRVKFAGSVVIGPGTRIGNNVTVSDSVIWDHTIIEDQVNMQSAIVGSNCRIPRGSSIDSGAAIASSSEFKVISTKVMGKEMEVDF